MRQSLPVLPQRSFGQTSRTDLWWITPLAVFFGLGTFIVYSTWAAFQNEHYTFGPYLSPFYSPLLFSSRPGWIPAWVPWSPALLILWAPGGFRFTCYYYRGAYYKAFWADPSSCAVGEPRKSFWGENSLPLILQNVHRYFMYLAVIFLFILAWDVWNAMWFETDAAGKAYTDGKHFGIGLGTLILALNVYLLSSYTLGCHSLRHLIGGKNDSLTKSPACHKAYNCVSCLNRSHMLYAWCSLVVVGFSDLYIRLCSVNFWHDWRLL
jgi:hypothetical protein